MKPLLPLRIAISLLLIAISAALLGLIGSSLSWKASHKHETALFTTRSALFSSNSDAGQADLVIFPLYTQTGSYAILIAAGCGGAVDQLLYLLFTLVKRNLFGSKIPNSMVAKALVCLRLCIGFAALVFSFIQYYDSSDFQMRLAPSVGTYGAGHFTMEAWTCQTRGHVEEGYKSDFGRLCKEGKAARWLLIPYLLLSLLLLGLEFWVGGRGTGRSSKSEFGSKDLVETGRADDNLS